MPVKCVYIRAGRSSEQEAIQELRRCIVKCPVMQYPVMQYPYVQYPHVQCPHVQCRCPSGLLVNEDGSESAADGDYSEASYMGKQSEVMAW